MPASLQLPADRPATRRVDWPDSALTLWARIGAHELDVPGDALPFSARLARDNHWSADYARRVVDEYKRFCFLACVADHPVTPSDQVDQVWHLHILYTEDYWNVFCAEVLGRDLHHGPTKGGAAEGTRFDDQYARTRHSYLRWFGHHAPVDVWPIATERFSRDTRWVRVNRDDFWLVPRPRSLWRRVRAYLGSALLVAMLVGSWAGIADARTRVDNRPTRLADAGYVPYGLAAGPFLGFFARTCIAVACAATLSSFARCRARGLGRGLGVDADLYTAALLTGGSTRAVLTALTRLVAEGHLSIGKDGNVIVHDPPPESGNMLERLVYRVAERDQSVKALRIPAGALRTEIVRIEQQAEHAGLLLPLEDVPRTEMIVAALFPVALAAPRIALALPAGRPIGFLVLMIIGFTVLGPLAVRRVRPRVTEGGRRTRQRLKEQSFARSGGSRHAVGDDLIWATAVLGTSALAGTALGDVDVLARQQITSSSTSGGSCGASCGGGGCGGCGGCGG